MKDIDERLAGITKSVIIGRKDALKLGVSPMNLPVDMKNKTLIVVEPDAIKLLIQSVCEEVIGANEDDKSWTPENQTMEYEEACSIEDRNELRASQRDTLQVLLNSDGKSSTSKR